MTAKKKAPPTKAESPSKVKWTESQKELFLKIRGEIDNLTRENANYMLNHILFPKVQSFATELGLNIIDENWTVDAENFQFVKQEKK